VATIEIEPFVAVEAALTVITCAAPGTMVTVAGLALSPFEPDKVASTVPLNPLMAEA
jgi:hypothetical protein